MTSDLLSKKLPLYYEDANNRHELLIKSEKDYIEYDLTLALRSKKHESTINKEYSFEGILISKFIFYPYSNQSNKSTKKSKEQIFFNLFGYPSKVYVNQQNEEVDYENQMLFISNKHLIPYKENTIKIYYHGVYNNQGVGIHHCTDPSDGKEYIFTHFEPFDTNRMLPHFDQPNLKASLSIKMIRPTTTRRNKQNKPNK